MKKHIFIAVTVGAALSAAVAVNGVYAEEVGGSGRGGASGSGVVDPTDHRTTNPRTDYHKSHRDWEKGAGDAPRRYGSGTADPQRGGFEHYHEEVPNGH